MPSVSAIATSTWASVAMLCSHISSSRISAERDRGEDRLAAGR